MSGFCLRFLSVILPGFLLIYSPVISNDSINPAVIGVRSHLSFVIVHSQDLRSMENTYPFGFGIDLKKRYTSKKTWDACNCYPMIGFSFTYWNFNNPGSLGNGLSAMFFAEPFFGFKRKVNLSVRAGFGLSYLSKPYDELENPDNLSYSSHLGFPLSLSLNLNYQLNPKLNLNIGANYNHISNGGVKYPNKGLNYPSLGIGLDYYLRPAKFVVHPKADWKKDDIKRGRHDISFLMSTTGIAPNEAARYLVLGAFYNYSYRIARISALNGGGEWVADGSLKARISRDSLNVDYHRVSVLLGHEFLLGHFVFSQQLGIYVYDPYKHNDAVYQRYGLIYIFNKRFLVGFNLKVHRYIADFMDFRFGVSF